MSKLSSSVISALPQATMNPRDYTKDGLLHCAVCGEPKEQIVSLLGAEHRMARECECERLEREETERRDRLSARAEKAEQYRAECFPFASMHAMTFENDDRDNPKITERCERYAENFAKAKEQRAGLLFFGDVGGGKTYHAASIANRVIDMGYSAVFTTIRDVSSELSAARFTGERGVLDRLCAHDLIVIDDLGTERSTDTAKEQANAIIDAIYLSDAVAIFTTNMDAKAMQEETEPTLRRMYSRITGMCQPVKVAMPDRRLKVDEGRADLYRSIW